MTTAVHIESRYVGPGTWLSEEFLSLTGLAFNYETTLVRPERYAGGYVLRPVFEIPADLFETAVWAESDSPRMLGLQDITVITPGEGSVFHEPDRVITAREAIRFWWNFARRRPQ